jgi:hypothetical protein
MQVGACGGRSQTLTMMIRSVFFWVGFSARRFVDDDFCLFFPFSWVSDVDEDDSVCVGGWMGVCGVVWCGCWRHSICFLILLHMCPHATIYVS